MKKAHAAWLAAIPLLAACSETSLTPLTPSTLTGLTTATALGANPERPFGGRCNTDITISPSLAGDAPNVLRLHIGYVCQLAHLGRTTAVAEQIVTFTGATTAIASNTTVYTAANGDQLFVTWTGTATANGPDNTFSGPETITGGTGRFAGATGSTLVNGTASFATMTGQFTSTGTISY
jgi:hypothetical protein